MEDVKRVTLVFHLPSGFETKSDALKVNIHEDGTLAFDTCSYWRSGLKRVGTVVECEFAPYGAIVQVQLNVRKSKGMRSTPAPCAVGEKPKEQDAVRTGWRRAGMGRKSNYPRSRIFSDWLERTFGSASLRGDDALVLDVAGGKGELAMELGFRGMPHIVIDPRPLGVDKMVKKLTLGWIKRHLCSCTDFDANDVCTKLWKGKEIPQAARDLMSRTKHIVHVPLPEAHLREYFWYPESPVKDCPPDTEALKEAMERTTVIVGMHADQATESIIDFGLERNVPFAVVPCCVFPRLFPKRTTPSGKPVRSYEDFISYLASKSDRVHVEKLDMVGRNTVIYGMGASADSTRL